MPKIKIRGPKELIGRSTVESILSGLFFGNGALCSGMIDQIEQKMKTSPKVILTGGHARLMKEYIVHKVDAVDEDLNRRATAADDEPRGGPLCDGRDAAEVLADMARRGRF